MGNCFTKKKILPLNSIPINENKEEENNNLDDITSFLRIEYEKVNKDIINKYGTKNVKEAIGVHWWYLRTNFIYSNCLLKEINDNIFKD